MHNESDETLEKVAQVGCSVSIPGDKQNSPKQSVEQPNLSLKIVRTKYCFGTGDLQKFLPT